MLCRTIIDPVESGSAEPVPGIGIFDTDIVFDPVKTLIRHEHGAYEVHHGRVARTSETPWIGEEGAAKGMFRGTHRHGHLEHDETRREFLHWVAQACNKTGFVLSPDTSFHGERDRQLDLIADALEAHWDLDAFVAGMIEP